VSAPARSRAGEPQLDPPAASLADPFGDDDLAWTVVEVGDGGDEVRVMPRVAASALHARLDAAHGERGWSVSYAAMPGEAIACHLVIDGVTKGAVAGPARVGGAEATAAIAFARAAALFGAAHAWPADASAWVACDPETREPLHAPARPEPSASRVGRPAEAARDDVTASAVAPAEDAFAETPAKPEGQQMIDRLIERLKAQGQGLEAARILVKHGGYGKDPQAARELYAALRQLLLAGGPRSDETGAASAEPSSGAVA
jgi:hypothetical protein